MRVCVCDAFVATSTCACWTICILLYSSSFSDLQFFSAFVLLLVDATGATSKYPPSRERKI